MREMTDTHLILLFEAVSLGALHLGDVLEQVGHADGRVELTRLIGHVRCLALPERECVCGVRGVHGVCGVSVGVRLHQAACVAGHRLRLVFKREKESTADLVKLREHFNYKKKCKKKSYTVFYSVVTM